jgi:O-antigen ligase/tetratricopeptide (TPR) repeat protein
LIDVEKSIERGFFCLLFLTPLLFGTVEFWSLAIMEALCVSLFLLWALRTLRAGTIAKFIEPPLLVPVGLLLGLSIIQIIPMPPSFLKILSPETYRVYYGTFFHPGALPWHTLSLYPHATVLEIVRLISYICVFFLTVQILKDKQSIERMTAAILVAGAGIALLGIFQMILWNGKLLWFRQLSHGGTPFGPYVNRNHFAGLMELLIPVCVGTLLHVLPPVRNKHGLKGALSDFFADGRTNSALLLSASAVVMITSLFLCLSRGGIIGLSLSMLLFGVMLFIRNSTKKKGRTIVLLFLIILLSVGWFGWKPVIARFEKMGHTGLSEYRIQNWRDSVKILKGFPLLGTGLGTYEHVYPRYKTVPAQERWEHAHNDYLEGAVELGAAGALVALGIVISFYRAMFGILRKRKSLYSRLLGIGGMAGVTGILVHSFVDFNLHVGANGLYFWFLMGFAVAVSHARVNDDSGGTLLRVREIMIPRRMRRPLMAACAAICVAISAIPILSGVAEIYYLMARGAPGEMSGLGSKSAMIEKARMLSPLDARLPFAAGNIDYFLGRKAEAVGNYGAATALNPVNGEYLQMLGIAHDNAGGNDSGEKYMELAVTYDPTSAWLRKNYSLWLFSKRKEDEAIREMREAIALDPRNTRKYITALVLSRLPSEKMRNAIPINPSALLIYGRYREDTGDTGEALDAYLEALSVMKREGTIRSEVYHRIAATYERKGLSGQALAFYEEGVKSSPSDADLRMSLARLYEKLDVPGRAIEEYERVLVLRPSDEYAQARLRELRKRQGGTLNLPLISPLG